MLKLIRHGESEANAGAVTSNYGDIALSDRGRAQAQAIAKYCTEVPVVNLEVHEFTYLATDRCSGMNSVGRQPLVDEYWNRMAPHYCDGTGSESFAGLLDRVDFFLLWATKQSGNCVIFTHEQFIRGVLLRTMYPHEQDLKKMMQIFYGLRVGQPIANGAIVRMKFSDARWWTGGVGVSHLSALDT